MRSQKHHHTLYFVRRIIQPIDLIDYYVGMLQTLTQNIQDDFVRFTVYSLYVEYDRHGDCKRRKLNPFPFIYICYLNRLAVDVNERVGVLKSYRN